MRLFMQTSQRKLRVISTIFNLVNPHPNDRLPLDHRVTRKRLGLETEIDLQALCLQCGTLHATEKDVYPSKCRSCQADLLMGDGSKQSPVRPIRTIAVQSFPQFISRILNNPLYQSDIDESWKTTQARTNTDHGLRTDFWDADYIRTIRGPPDSTEFFCEIPPGEIRLAFALSVDWFNPLFNKESGRKVSIGPVFLICLNLPRHERYKEPNMFLLFIIPGPNEPSVEDPHLNNALNMVVDLFLPYWDPGVFYTYTDRYKDGCIVRLILALIICDLVAARRITGLPNHNALEPCSICLIKRSELGNIAIVDDKKCRRTDTDCRDAIQRVAETTDRDKLTGIRYSPLYRLPYFSPTKMTIIDVMHTVFLNVVHHHFLGAYGIRTLTADIISADLTVSPREMKVAQHVFVYRPPSGLKKCNNSQLLALIHENALEDKISGPWRKTTKLQLLKILEVCSSSNNICLYLNYGRNYAHM
jgi:hypothetical protein